MALNSRKPESPLPRQNEHFEIPRAESPKDYELDEAELRELYNNDEIERFLDFFSAYVTEVRDPTLAKPTLSQPEETSDTVDSDGPHSDQPSDYSISEIIARNVLLPILPPPPNPAPAFTIGRLRLTVQRLYVVGQTAYLPFFLNLFSLASWEQRNRSASYCTVYWVLWWHNLILPAILLRVLYSLLRRRFMSYPTLKELRAHRQRMDEAEEVGQQLQSRLSASSSIGFKEVWRLFRVLNKDKKMKTKDASKEALKAATDQDQEIIDESIVVNEPNEPQEEKDIRRQMLNAMNEIADLHERLKNLFIWRRPSPSRLYGSVIFLIFLLTLLLPAQLLAKTAYLVLGVLFWHILPVIMALPAEDRRRLPPAFGDLPTDADFAMDLISQRVAAGLEVKRPTRHHIRRHRRNDGESEGTRATSRDSASPSPDANSRAQGGLGTDWQKWARRAASGMQFANDTKRLFTSSDKAPEALSEEVQTRRAAPCSASVSQTAEETHSFPAQHATAPGLITLTPDLFYFTSLASSETKVKFPVTSVNGVKKSGTMGIKGLTISWSQDDKEHEEKFRWIGGRDELFARLVAHGSGRWVRG